MLTIFSGAGQPSRDEKAEQERRSKAMSEGQPSLINKLAGRGAYMEEYKKQREKINKRYQALVRQYHKEWRKNKVEEIKELARRDKKMKSHYRLDKLTEVGGPALDRSQRLYDKRSGRLTENTWKNFGKSKRAALKQLRAKRKSEQQQVAHGLKEQAKQSQLDSMKSSLSLNYDPRGLGAHGTDGASAHPKYLSPREQFMAAQHPSDN